MLKTIQRILKRRDTSNDIGVGIKISNVIVIEDGPKDNRFSLKLTEHGNYQIYAGHDLITIPANQMKKIVEEMYPNIQKILGSKE